MITGPFSRLRVGRPRVELRELHVGNEIKHQQIAAVCVRAVLSDGVTAETSMSHVEARQLAASLLRAAEKAAS